MVNDVLAKLDQARQKTAELQRDYRCERDEKRRQANRATQKRFRDKDPEAYRAYRRAIDSRRREAESAGGYEVERFIGFLMAEQCACVYCLRAFADDEDVTVDHIQPLSRGGAHSVGNVILCCAKCNSRKWAKTGWADAYEFTGKTRAELTIDRFEQQEDRYTALSLFA